jgi:hypothetical protein
MTRCRLRIIIKQRIGDLSQCITQDTFCGNNDFSVIRLSRFEDSNPGYDESTTNCQEALSSIPLFSSLLYPWSLVS